MTAKKQWSASELRYFRKGERFERLTMREFLEEDDPDAPIYYQDTPAGEALADWAWDHYFGPHPNPMKFYDDRTLQECR